MKTIGIYKLSNELYGNLIERLERLGIQIKPLKDGQVDEDIDLYIFDMDNPGEFENIKFDRPFVIVSSLNDKRFLIKSLKAGALDFISRPFTDMEVTVKRIQRLLEKGNNAGAQVKTAQTEKHDKLIDIELKRAHRGKYPVVLASINFEAKLNRETMIKLIDKMKTVLRDSDSCIPYTEHTILVVLPFADKAGSAIVARKITELLNSLNYKSHSLCSTYPEDGETREELMKNLGKGFDSRGLYK